MIQKGCAKRTRFTSREIFVSLNLLVRFVKSSVAESRAVTKRKRNKIKTKTKRKENETKRIWSLWLLWTWHKAKANKTEKIHEIYCFTDWSMVLSIDCSIALSNNRSIKRSNERSNDRSKIVPKRSISIRLNCEAPKASQFQSKSNAREKFA